ncbi:unnamed protein product, partial [Iphiclides podalirius]
MFKVTFSVQLRDPTSPTVSGAVLERSRVIPKLPNRYHVCSERVRTGKKATPAKYRAGLYGANRKSAARKQQTRTDAREKMDSAISQGDALRTSSALEMPRL